MSVTHGVHISRTAKFPSGRLTQNAMAAAVCDLQAVRKVFQMGTITSNWFCSRCNCYHKREWGRTDCDDWTLRSADDLKKQIAEWSAQTSMKGRDEVYSKYGIRYSEFWRLPYFDPARQLTVDSMHCLYENMISHHCRQVLTLTEDSSGSTPGFVPEFSLPIPEPKPEYFEKLKKSDQFEKRDYEDYKKIMGLLTTASLREDVADGEHRLALSLSDLEKKLSRMRYAPLAYVYRHIPIALLSPNPSIKAMASALAQWVCRSSIFAISF